MAISDNSSSYSYKFFTRGIDFDFTTLINDLKKHLPILQALSASAQNKPLANQLATTMLYTYQFCKQVMPQQSPELVQDINFLTAFAHSVIEGNNSINLNKASSIITHLKNIQETLESATVNNPGEQLDGKKLLLDCLSSLQKPYQLAVKNLSTNNPAFVSNLLKH